MSLIRHTTICVIGTLAIDTFILGAPEAPLIKRRPHHLHLLGRGGYGLRSPRRELLQRSEPICELPPDAEEGAPHGPVAGPTARVPTIHFEDCRAPRGILRALVGKAHDKGTDRKELEILCPHVLESVVVVDRGL
jgi:hypothetical protein